MNPVQACNLDTFEELVGQIDHAQYHCHFNLLEKKLIREIAELTLKLPPQQAREKLLRIRKSVRITEESSPHLALLMHALDGAIEAALVLCN
ncbi:MAG: hypothetical protein ABIE84_05150 [bacterium]